MEGDISKQRYATQAVCSLTVNQDGWLMPECLGQLLLTPFALGGSLCRAACVVLELGPTPLMYHSCPLSSEYFHLGKLGGHGQLPAEKEPVGRLCTFPLLRSAKVLTSGSDEPFFRHTQIGQASFGSLALYTSRSARKTIRNAIRKCGLWFLS